MYVHDGMRIAARNELHLLCAVGLAAFAAMFGVSVRSRSAAALALPEQRVATVTHEVEPADERTSWQTSEEAHEAPDEVVDSPEALLGGYEAIALELLNGPTVSDRQLEARLQAHPKIAADVEVHTLRDGERVILWQNPPPKIHGGGARASVFIREAMAWRLAGYVDPEAWTSSVSIGGIDAEHGIAFLVESYSGNGWPPMRVVALAVDRGRIATVAVDDVPRVEVDHEARLRPTVRLWRRTENLNRYPNPPIRGSRWRVRRVRGELVATESPLTPWVDALAAFCADPRGSHAVPSVRAIVDRCDGDVALRWTQRKRLVATLDLVLRCGDDAVRVQDGELTLARDRRGWRVVASTRCPEASL